MMERKFETLIDEAIHQTDTAGNANPEDAPIRAQCAIAYALIAIAQELHEMNSRENHKFANDK